MIHNEDCLDTMDLMLQNSIDLVVTSPPYENLRDYANFDFNKVSAQLYRVIKHGGVLIWVVTDQVLKGSESGNCFRQALYFKDLGFNIHDTMIWNKQHVFGGAGNPAIRYSQVFEYIFVFSKGRPKTFNPITVKTLSAGRVHRLKKVKDRRKEVSKGIVLKEREYIDGGDKIVGNIFTYFTYFTGFNKTTKDKIAFKQPAIFPDALARDMILSFSNIGDLVYDPFAGSGTTLKQAFLLERKFIGSEISAEYCEIIKERLEIAKIELL